MEADLKEVVTMLVKNRWPFKIHATYNESITRILTVLEEINREIPFNDLRWSIDHAETVTEENVDRIAALGGGIAVQSRMAFLGEDFVERYGMAAAKQAPPFKMIMDKGVPIGLGTDGTRGSTFNPWVTLHWITTGKTVGGLQIYGKEDLLTREEALRLHTVGSSWFSGEEGLKGRIAVGQLSDFVLTSEDYFTVPDEKIKNIESVLTVVDGKVVYGASEYTALSPELPPVQPVWSPYRRFGSYYTSKNEGDSR